MVQKVFSEEMGGEFVTSRTRRIAKRAYVAIRPLIPNVVDEIIHMYINLGYFPNVWKPRSFNEKIAHRKLFSRDPRFAKLADKWAVRDYVQSLVGKQYLTEVYAHVTDPYSIDLSTLPRSFVVKATHDCGSTILVDDKNECDWEEICRRFSERMVPYMDGIISNQYWYKDIPPAILVEERLRDATYDVPLDYKLFVFHGKVCFIQVIASRFVRKATAFYDRKWNRVSVSRPRFADAETLPRPRQLEHMIEVAEVLASDFDFVRVDLYAVNDERVVFGELTFAPAAGREPFIPRNFDYQLGSYW